MVAKPSVIPTIDSGNTNRTAPPAGKQTAGYLLNDIFPSDEFNWTQGYTSDWLTWIDERWSDGATANDLDFDATGILTWNNAGGHRMIGGLDVGFITGTPTADVLRVFDEEFRFQIVALNPTIIFDDVGGPGPLDSFSYNRASDYFAFEINNVDEVQIYDTGIRILNGLYVGSLGTAPTDDDITCDGGINCGGSVNPTPGDGIFASGLVVGGDLAVVDNAVIISDGSGDDDFRLWNDGTDPRIIFDDAAGVLDQFYYDRSADNYFWVIADANAMRLDVNNSLFVDGGVVAGTWVGAAYDNDFRASSGGIICGGTTNPASGQGIFAVGVMGGADAAPTSGVGVEGRSTTSYGVVAQGDTTSPTTAAFRIVPQDTQPSGPNQKGDLYVSSAGAGTLHICTTAGTPGIWAVVGSQT